MGFVDEKNKKIRNRLKNTIKKRKKDKASIVDRLVLNFFLLVVFLLFIVAITQQIENKKIYINLEDSDGNKIKSNIFVLNEDGSKSYLKKEGVYNLVIKPQKTPIKEIMLNNATSNSVNNLKIDELEKNELDNSLSNIKQAFAIDPTEVKFNNGSIKIKKAIGRELYKCGKYVFEEKRCNGKWEKIMDLIPGQEYEIQISKYDPAFVEVDAITCKAEDLEETRSSFNDLCDSSDGMYLKDDDDYYEVYNFRKYRGKKYYAGIKIEAYDSSVENCSNITEVYLCYKWWADSYSNICSIEVDADNETSWSQVSNSCPAQTEPQDINCVDISNLEDWNCSNFFGIGGIKAKAKSEVTTNIPEGIHKAYWDVFYFNVSYNESDIEPPEIILEEPEDDMEFLIPEVHIKYIVNDLNNVKNCTLFLDNRTNQTHFNPRKNVVNEFILYNLTNGTYMWHIRCSDSRGNIRETERHRFNISNPLLYFNEIVYPDIVNLSDSFNLSVNITSKRLDSVWVYFEGNKIIPSSNSSSQNNNNNNGNNIKTEYYVGTIDVPLNSSTRNVSFYVYANDTAGNINSSNETIFVYDNIKPNIALISPANNTITTNKTTTFIFNVSDYNSGIDRCNLVIDDMNYGDNFNISSGDNMQNNISMDLIEGEYSWGVRCYDSFGNFNYSNKRRINVNLNDVLVNVTLKDSKFVKVNSTGAFLSGGNVKYFYDQRDDSLNVATGMYDLFVSTSDKIASKDIKMRFKNVNISSDIGAIIDVDDGSDLDYKNNIYVLNKYVDSPVLVETYSNDRELYKCEEWNFTERKCFGEWRRIKRLDNGKKYKFLLTSNDPAYGEGSSLTLKTITIDGDLSDWDSILINEKNVIIDGITDVNDADNVANSNFDLTDFAFTWDDTNLYFYFKKVAKSNAKMSILVYIDRDLDGYMNSTDKVVKYIISGTQYSSYLYNYVPSNSSGGDLMGGDGETMPGTLTNQTSLEASVTSTNSERIKFEAKVPWSYVGTAGIPLYMHVSSARSTASSLPSDIRDNMPLASSLIIDVSISPDRESSSTPGGNVIYNHTIKNFGNKQDVVDISTSATRPGWNVSLHYSNGTLLSDSDSDGIVDVVLGPGNEQEIFVNITIPNNETNGVEDNTVVWTTSSLNSSISDSVIDTTHLGGVIVLPDKTGTIVAGLNITYNHTVYNNQNINDSFEIVFNSTQNWSAEFYIDGIGLNDSDGDGYVDFNISANSQIIIVMNLSVPSSSSVGTIDYSTIKIVSNNNAGNYDNVVDETEVSERLELYPNNKGYVGIGEFIYYEHTIKNNWNQNDTIDINVDSTKGWDDAVYCCDKTTQLNDSDGDGIVDVELGAFGDQKTIYLKIEVPDATNENEIDISTITGNSSISNSSSSAIDNTTARILITYNDSIRQTQTDYFKLNQTIYAKATGLSSTLTVYFVWIDSNASIVKISNDVGIDIEGKAYDEFSLNESSRIGNWTLVLYDAANDREITRSYLYVKVAPNVTVIRPNGGEVFYGIETINWSAEDLDNDTFNISIQYSPDNGTTWFLIVSGLPNSTTDYSWDTTPRYDGNNYLIKVIAYDWYQSGYDVSDSVFSIDNTNITINWVNATPNPVNFNGVLNITANITSTSGVDSAWVLINGTNYTMEYSGSGDVWYYNALNVSSLYADTYNYTIYANNTNGYEATPKTSNFTINSYVAILITKVPINFTNVLPGGTTNATINAGWPSYVKNLGNVKVNITMNGTDLVGVSDSTYTINVGKVYWDFTNPFTTNHILTSSSAVIINELGMNENKTIYFKMVAPLNIKSQNYTGNITFVGYES